MSAKITIEQVTAGKFNVRVAEEASPTVHQVTVSREYYNLLTNGTVSEEMLLRRSFEFLLEREAKESILRQFDLREINRYFPAFDRIIKGKFGCT